jgi:sigma54-dependent transcription regulator
MTEPCCWLNTTHWHPCQQPERPIDKHALLHVVDDCNGCWVALQAEARRNPNRLVQTNSPSGKTRMSSVSDRLRQHQARGVR